MRILLAGMVGSLVALVGLASTANASATIELLWEPSGTTNTSVDNISSSVVLNIVYTNTEQSLGASVSVDYSNLVGEYSVVQFTNNPGLGGVPLQIILGPAVDTGSQITNIQALCFLSSVQGFSCEFLNDELAAGQSYLLGTITFHKDTSNPGLLSVSAFLGPGDSIAGGGLTVCNQGDVAACTLGSATLGNVPEPSTLSLLALGLIGLTLKGTRRGN